MKRLINKLNSFTLFQKMTIIYITCIIIPLCAIFVFYYSATVGKIKADNVENVKLQAENVANEIKDEFFQLMAWTSGLYLDENLYKFLNEEYTTYSQAKALIDYIDSGINRSYQLHDTSADIKIYTDNKSIFSSEHLLKFRESEKNSEWYKKHINGGTNVSVFINEEILSDGINAKKYFSIIRNMDCYPLEYETLINLEVEVDYFKKISKSIYTGSSICILDRDNNIIVSSDAKLTQYVPTKDWVEADLDLGGTVDLKIAAYIDKVGIEGADAKNTFAFAIIILSIIALTLIVIYAVSLSMTKRFEKITHCMKNIENHVFIPIEEDGIGKDEIAELISSTNKLTLRLKSLIEEVYEAELRQKKAELDKQNAELKALQSQINPHFLFNTLETIRLKSLGRKEKETAGIIKNLSKMFRRMISWGEDIIDFKTELEYITEYLEIQKYRFGEELRIKTETDAECLLCQLPKMVFQVFVENACVHGIESVSGEKLITIVAKKEGNMLVLSVTDNGIGMSEEIKQAILSGEGTKKERVGTSNAISRLRYYYGERFSLEIKSECGKTKIVLKIPQDECLKKEGNADIDKDI